MSLPGAIDTKTSTGNSKDEQYVLDYLNELKEESEDAKKKFCPVEDDKDALKLYRGQYKPGDRNQYYSCDFVQMFIDRMVAGLTDNRPVLRVENRKQGLKKMASALEKSMTAVWQEEDMQRKSYRMCHNSAIRRSSGMYTGYDAINDCVSIEILTKDQVHFDPQINESSQIDQGEFVIVERIKPVDELVYRFPGRGALIKSEDVSFTSDKERSGISIKSPVTDLLKSSPRKSVSRIIPRTYIYEAFLRDRQCGADGEPYFPHGRRLIYTKDLVLWDGPVPYWDGQFPVDWFDWGVDPEHPWGISAPMMLKRLQLSFNEILDGTVANHILSNFLLITGASDVLDPAQWANLQKITNSLILRKTSANKELTVTPPPSFGADKLNMAKALFTYAQLMTGVTDVTLGEHPGSLQSGQAIEGLQEGASLMTRSRASRLEDFYGRVGSKLMARILQFWPGDRVFHLLGPGGEAFEYILNRKELFINDDGSPVSDKDRRDVFRHLRFAVLPGSSAPGTRQKRAEMMVKLMMLGCATRKMVLEAADFNDVDRILLDVQEEFKTFPPPGFERKKAN